MLVHVVRVSPLWKKGIREADKRIELICFNAEKFHDEAQVLSLFEVRNDKLTSKENGVYGYSYYVFDGVEYHGKPYYYGVYELEDVTVNKAPFKYCNWKYPMELHVCK